MPNDAKTTVRVAPPPPSVQRQVATVVVAALATVLAALIFGEYDMSGITPYVGGILFGLVIAEVVLTVARVGNRALAGAAAVCTGAGMYWAVWISSGRGIAPIPGRAYVGVALAVIVSGGWVVASSGRRRRGGASTGRAMFAPPPASAPTQTPPPVTPPPPEG